MTQVIKIKDWNIEDAEEEERQTDRLEILSGDFFEGEMVTVRILDKIFTRKVKYSARKWADLYITVNGRDITYTEFYNPEDYWDIDYQSIIGK